MRFLPYDCFTIKTRLSPDEVKIIIHGFVETKRWIWKWSSNHKPYMGEVKKEKFRIFKVNWYRNSLLPVISGEILPSLDGSIIQISMRPFGLVIAFMLLIFGFLGYGLLNMIGDWVLYLTQIKPMTIVSYDGMIKTIIVILIIYAFILCAYKFESIRSRYFIYAELTTDEYPGELIYNDKIFGLSIPQIILLMILAAICYVILTVFVKMLINV